ncbi:hypothetical protein [Actinacidiphila paucisporea]|uniref:hypothetical protein n=1 Tax=Actinacidiphila paucisporea TaxID=310782 RepID=UPI0009360459|nr:hypothetical protein [Actinacidiphila paucisporea]
MAYSPIDLLEFLRRAGLDPDTVDLTDLDLFEWRGEGPGVWVRRHTSLSAGQPSNASLNPFWRIQRRTP